MRISYPITNPTNYIDLPEPNIRDQTSIKISTTFKRMSDGSIIPFKHTPLQKSVSLTFNTLQYKQARLFVNFLLEGNNQSMLFEGSSEFLEEGSIIGTVTSDPYALVTISKDFKSLSIVVALQQTQTLSNKHLGISVGGTDEFPMYKTFNLITGDDGVNYLSRNTEYNLAPDINGFWVEKAKMPVEKRNVAGFTYLGKMHVVSGLDALTPVTSMHIFTPSFDESGFWVTANNFLNIARTDAVACTLSDGGVIFGGINASSAIISCIERFNQNSWSLLPSSFCFGLKNACSFNTPRAYIISGFDGAYTSVVQEYVEETDVITFRAHTPTAPRDRASAGGCVAYSKGIIFGGVDNTLTILNTTSLYDEVAVTLTVGMANLPAVSFNNSGVGTKDRVFSVSGESAPTVYTQVNSEYSIEADTWTVRTITTAPASSNAIALATYLGGSVAPEDAVTIPPVVPFDKGVVVLWGGNISPLGKQCQSTNKTFEWDFGAMVAKGDIATLGKNSQCSASLEGIVYAIDGVEKSSRQAVANFNSYQDGVWTTLEAQNSLGNRQPRYKGNAETIGDKIYIANGWVADGLSGRNPDMVAWNPKEKWTLRLNNTTTLISEFGASCASSVLDESIIFIQGINVRYKPNVAVSELEEYISARVVVLAVETNSFSLKADMTPLSSFSGAGYNGGAITIEGDVYAFTCVTAPNYIIQKRTMKYDSLGDTWVARSLEVGFVTQQHTTHSYAVANTSVTDKCAFFGGVKTGGITSDNNMVYDATTNAFSATPAWNLVTATFDLCAQATQEYRDLSSTNKLFVTGGIETFIYDPLTNVSTHQNSQVSGPAINDIVCFNVAGVVWLLGSDNTQTAGGVNAWNYNVAFPNKWINANKLFPALDVKAPRRYMSGCVILGNIYLMGGESLYQEWIDYTVRTGSSTFAIKLVHVPANVAVLKYWSFNTTTYIWNVLGGEINRGSLSRSMSANLNDKILSIIRPVFGLQISFGTAVTGASNQRSQQTVFDPTVLSSFTARDIGGVYSAGIAVTVSSYVWMIAPSKSDIINYDSTSEVIKFDEFSDITQPILPFVCHQIAGDLVNTSNIYFLAKDKGYIQYSEEANRSNPSHIDKFYKFVKVASNIMVKYDTSTQTSAIVLYNANPSGQEEEGKTACKI